MANGQEIVKAADGMPAILQGSWSENKLYFLNYFMNMFNSGMKNKWAFRAYVDLFSGPGICIDRATGREFYGSPLRAMGCKTPFTHLYLNDSDAESVRALEVRQKSCFLMRIQSITSSIAMRQLQEFVQQFQMRHW